MSFHGQTIFLKNNHPTSNFGVQARRIIQKTIEVNKDKVDEKQQEKINTLSSDLRVLLEEHNKREQELEEIIKSQNEKFTLLSSKLEELESKISEKKDSGVQEAILILKEGLKTLPPKIPSKPSSGTSSPTLPLSKPALVRYPNPRKDQKA